VADFLESVESVKKNMVTMISIILAAFLMYTALFGEYTVYIQRGFPLLLTSLLIFIRYPVTKKAQFRNIGFIIDMVFIVATLFSTLYLMINYAAISQRIGIETKLDVIVGMIGIIIVLESARRTTGWAIPIIAFSFSLYAYFGKYVPGFFFS